MTEEIVELHNIISEANVSQVIEAGQDALDSIPEMIEASEFEKT